MVILLFPLTICQNSDLPLCFWRDSFEPFEKNEHYLKEKEHIYIPKNTIHRIENIGKEELIFIEIQLGENLKEEDIIRLEDDYGRV